MRNPEKDEVALVNIDRNPLILVLSIVTSAVLGYFSYTFILDLNPWGFILMVPATFVSFQTIWLLLTPFAMVFDDKLEIKRSLFRNKMFFFVDLKKIGAIKNTDLFISYNDNEVAKIKV